MDTSTAAAVAALVVAIVAMFVAIMQALQQYFVSGQLIRLCDSVVFGKMPGRGQRVWQLRQFRFRIVYNVPQVSLKRDLWPETLPHIPSYAKGSGSLPDLGLMGVEDNGAQSSKNEHSSFAPGEASWVSFCRAVQFSSGQSMVLDLIQGDADRCPVDLPNVPMQMSMRDVAVMGLMSGMKCTQASFAEKSLSMQGLIGTITTSQHPLLGPLLHFSPRNFSASEMKDLRVGNGAIDPRWMAHLWDEVVVAGHRYTRQDRIRIERDEATWTQRPRGRAVILANRNRSPPPESIYGLRRRASVASSTFSSRSRYTDRPKSTRKSKDFVRSTSPPKHQTLWTRSDGDWYLINNQTASSHLRPTLCQDMAHQEKPSEFDKQEGIINKIRMWSKIWNYIFRDDNVHQYGGGTDPFTVEIERGEVKIKRMDLTQSENMILRDVHQFPAPPYQPLSFQDRGADLQPRWFIKDYIDQKREEIHGKDTLHKNRSNAPLLIGWYDDEDHEIPELGEAKESIAKAVLEMWPRSQYGSSQERTAFYAHRWRELVQQRQFDRESRSRSRNPSQARSSVSGVMPRSIDRFRRVNVSRHRSSVSRQSQDSRSTSRSFRRPGLDIEHEYPSIHRRSSYDPGMDSRDLYPRNISPEPHSLQRLQETYSRSSSHVRSRPASRRDVQYGDTILVHDQDNNEQPSGIPESKLYRSPDKQDTREHTKVGFGHAIYLIESSSSDDLGNETDNDHSTDRQNSVLGAEPSSSRAQYPEPPPKSILKPPRPSFPEEPNPIREGVAPLKDTTQKGIPPGARWTKIDRKLVSPEALESGFERFEVRENYVVVLRVLQKEEIESYALRTQELLFKGGRRQDHSMSSRQSSRTNRNEERRGRRRRRDGSLSPNSAHEPFRTASKYPTRFSEGDVLLKNPSPPTANNSPPQTPHPKSSPHMSRNENENEIDDESCRSSDDTFKDISQSSPREGRMFFRFNDGNSDTSFSEPEVEEPSSIYSGRIRRMRPPSDLLNEARWNNSNDDMLTDKSLSADEYLDCASGEMGWFWVCQIDVIPGYFATPWTARFSTDICIGAIAVIIEALGIVTDFSQPAYLEISCHPRGLAWMRSGYSTFPPYGVSANHHHGTVISGAYDTQSLPGFRDPLFPIELLGHYGFQVDGRQPSDAANLRARLTELMALDSWLSYCGRQPEICGYGHGINNGATVTGAGDLLYTMPTLVKRTMDSFSLEFTNLERTAINGGQQLVRQIAVNLLDTLGWKVEGLSPAEKLFALVAMLRASKMALCISQGTDTSALRDIMLNDVQAHLV